MKVLSTSVPPVPVPAAHSIPDFDFAHLKASRRDVVLINPYTPTGSDDANLANKIANLAVEAGCRISIVPVPADESDVSPSPHRNVSSNDVAHVLADLHDPVFVVAPVGILPMDRMTAVIDELSHQHNFSRSQAVLIEEMDLLTEPDQGLESRQKALEQLGFSNVNTMKLGFEEGAIGYLPVDKTSYEHIQQRFDSDIRKLLDSYNFSLSSEHDYNIAYISSSLYMVGTEVFIANTLAQDPGSARDSTYLMIIPDLGEPGRIILPEQLDDVLTVNTEEFNLTPMFSQAHVSFADPVSGEISWVRQIDGSGNRKVNIVFVPSLPQNIFHDFMCLSQSGMASGDQSLSDYISLRGAVPYYDMQPWKYPLAKALSSVARTVGDAELADQQDERIIGQGPYTGNSIYKLSSHAAEAAPSAALKKLRAKFDEDIRARKADEPILELFRSFAQPPQ